MNETGLVGGKPRSERKLRRHPLRTSRRIHWTQQVFNQAEIHCFRMMRSTEKISHLAVIAGLFTGLSLVIPRSFTVIKYLVVGRLYDNKAKQVRYETLVDPFGRDSRAQCFREQQGIVFQDRRHPSPFFDDPCAGLPN